MDGSNLVGGFIPGDHEGSWRAGGWGDFSGDGHFDVLWVSDSGETAVWKTNGVGMPDGASFGGLGSNWNVIGAGDYDGNGALDPLWQNSAGQEAI
jgi:hypothetical protein